MISNVAVVPVVPDHVALFVELLVLIFTVYPLHVVQLLPSFFIVNVTLFVLDTLLVAVNVVAAPALNVVDAVVVLVTVLDVDELAQLVNVYPLDGVATMACIALVDPSATTVPAFAKLVPLNVIVVLLNDAVIV